MVCTCRAIVSRYGHSVPFLTLLLGFDTESEPFAVSCCRSPEFLCNLFGPSSASSGLSRFILPSQAISDTWTAREKLQPADCQRQRAEQGTVGGVYFQACQVAGVVLLTIAYCLGRKTASPVQN